MSNRYKDLIDAGAPELPEGYKYFLEESTESSWKLSVRDAENVELRFTCFQKGSWPTTDLITAAKRLEEYRVRDEQEAAFKAAFLGSHRSGGEEPVKVEVVNGPEPKKRWWQK